MRTISAEELQKILEDHKLWLSDKGGKRADLSGAILSGADLSHTNLSHTNLSHANLSGANLRHANLSHTNLYYANLSHANLSGANLRHANLYYARFSGARLSGARLIDAYLSGADLSGIYLSGADLSEANLSGAKGIKVAACHWSGHGERGRLLNAVEIGEEVMFFCGCFQGNEQKLRDFIAKGDQAYVASRTKALEFLLSCF